MPWLTPARVTSVRTSMEAVSRVTEVISTSPSKFRRFLLHDARLGSDTSSDLIFTAPPYSLHVFRSERVWMNGSESWLHSGFLGWRKQCLSCERASSVLVGSDGFYGECVVPTTQTMGAQKLSSVRNSSILLGVFEVCLTVPRRFSWFLIYKSNW